jgi:Vitamin K-dependent gamma-carboxylase
MRFSRFFAWFFSEKDNTWLTILRIGLGLQLTLYELSMRRDWLRLLNVESRRVSEAVLAAEGSTIPRVGWLVTGGTALGLNETQILQLIWLVLLGAALCLIAGLFCRTAAVTGWLVHLMVVKSTSVFSYGVDSFTTIGLFYLALSPLPDFWSLDWQSRNLRPRYADLTGFFRRTVQLHLCFIYFFSGLTKFLGSGWWNGDNLWRALTRPPFDVIDPVVIARGKSFLPVAGIAICLLELGYAVFIWPKQTRTFWLLAIIGVHIGIGVFMDMPLFGFVMIVLNVAAFGPELMLPRQTDLAEGVVTN